MKKAANSRRGNASFSDEDVDAIAAEFEIENREGLRALLNSASWYRLPVLAPKSIAGLLEESDADENLSAGSSIDEFAEVLGFDPNAMPDHAGRLNERQLLVDLAEGFKTLTGRDVKRWTKSEFIKFASMVLTHLGLPPQSDEALRKQVSRLLGDVRDHGESQ